MRLHQRFSGGCLVPLLAGLLVSLTPLRADTLVVPNNMASQDTVFASGTLRSTNYRSQRVYGAAHFPPGIGLRITELRFRPDRQMGFAFTTTVQNIQISLSTTIRNPDALNATYASNVGSDSVLVFSGALDISSQFTGPANGPKDFDIAVPLTTPFLYNPAGGNLLVDIRNMSGSAAAAPLSGQAVSNDQSSRVGGSLSASTGTLDTGTDAMLIVYTPTEPPPVPAQPILLFRGPYLQNATLSNIIVRWRTDRITNSVVRFGTSPLSLAWSVTNHAPVTEHSVTLTNLSPDTRYYYSIGASGTNFVAGPEFSFITPTATNRPIRIWVIGDFGSAAYPWFGIINDPFGMRDSYYAFTSNRYTDVWLMLGDNAYFNGTDSEYQTNLFGVFPTMLAQTVAWSTIGNHDAVNAAVYGSIFDLPRNGEFGGVPSGTELYYSFDYGNVHFICLDSEISSRNPGSPMLNWLEADLDANTNEWVIAFWHTPPYTFGSHNSDSMSDSAGRLFEMRQNVVPILESYGVDLVLAGHSHNYERSKLIDGHYGVSETFAPTMAKDAGSGREDDSGAYLKPGHGSNPHEGAIYSVVGSSGWVTGAYIPSKYLTHPAMYVSLGRVGSLVVDVSDNRMHGTFVSNEGTIDDYFTILKGVGPEPLRVKTIRVVNETVALQFKTIAGKRYRVLYSNDLGSGIWQPASDVITATGATTMWSEPWPGDTGNHFYQVMLVD